jgi:hypothetical protein
MRRILAVFGGIVVAACGSHSVVAPTPPLLVTLSGPSVVQENDTTVNGQPAHLCDYPVTVTVTGGGPGTVATWGRGHWTLVEENGGSGAGEYSTVSQFFNDDSYVLPGTYSEAVGLIASTPFRFSQVFYYSTVAGRSDSLTYSLSCQ